MADHIQRERRDSRSEARERVSVDGAIPSRGRSQQRRPSRPYVRPAVEDDDDDVDDDDEPPRSRPPPVQYAEPRVVHREPLARSYAPIYHPDAPGTRPTIAQASRYRRYPAEEHYGERDRRFRSPSPPDFIHISSRPGDRYYEPGPNFPRRTTGFVPGERTSFHRPRPGGGASPPDSRDGTRRRRSRHRHHAMDTTEVVDEDGGHYDRPSLPHRAGACREAEPTTTNQQVTTSSYYDGSGNRAWTRKNQERSGIGPPPELLVDPDEPAPPHPR